VIVAREGNAYNFARTGMDASVARDMMNNCPKDEEFRPEVERAVAKVHCAWATALSVAYQRESGKTLTDKTEPETYKAVMGAYSAAGKHCASQEELNNYKGWARDLILGR
jgi:hypothetical protein